MIQLSPTYQIANWYILMSINRHTSANPEKGGTYHSRKSTGWHWQRGCPSGAILAHTPCRYDDNGEGIPHDAAFFWPEDGQTTDHGCGLRYGSGCVG